MNNDAIVWNTQTLDNSLNKIIPFNYIFMLMELLSGFHLNVRRTDICSNIAKPNRKKSEK